MDKEKLKKEWEEIALGENGFLLCQGGEEFDEIFDWFWNKNEDIREDAWKYRDMADS